MYVEEGASRLVRRTAPESFAIPHIELREAR